MADEAPKHLALREIIRDPNALAEKRKELDTLRSHTARDWALNREFYNGNQWVFWNRAASRIESVPVDDADKPRHKVRLTANQIKRNANALVAQMTKTRPVIRATPDSASDKSVKAAQMGERLYEYWYQEFGLSAKTTSALLNAQIDQGYWLIDWDALAGKTMTVLLHPETGQPITDEALADAFRDELAQMGLPAEMFEQTVAMGDISVRVLSGTQVWLDPTATSFEDAKYAVCRISLEVDEIEARWNKKVTPNASTAEFKPALMYTRGDDGQKPKNARDVYLWYVRPSAMVPKGRYVVSIEGPNEILFDSAWDAVFPTNDLPLVKFPGIERPGSVYDDARITDVRPLQKELNETISQRIEHRRLTMKPQVFAPFGSLRDKLTNEPGRAFLYNVVHGQKPEWRELPNLPSYVIEEINDLRGQIREHFNLIPTERAQLPARTDSGHMVELVQEAVADQISPEILRLEMALARAGQLMAALAKRYYGEMRMLKIRGEGGSVQVAKFMRSDLEGGFTFHAEAGSGLPRTRAGRTQELREMIEMGLISPQEALPYMPIAGLKVIQSRMAAGEEMALREHDKLLRGEPVNVVAMMQAIEQVKTGMNPETGEMFMSPEEASGFVETAALTPLPYENLQQHASLHALHMQSVEFERYPPEIQARFLQHHMLTVQQLQGMSTPSEPIKTSLALKGTVGPTVAAEILQQNGIKGATPETMAEPPLETSVYDSVDKPDMDEAGNDPLTDQDRLLAMEQNEEKHQLQMAKAQHELARAEREHEAAEEDRGERRRREEETHQERLKQMRKPASKGSSGE